MSRKDCSANTVPPRSALQAVRRNASHSADADQGPHSCLVSRKKGGGGKSRQDRPKGKLDGNRTEYYLSHLALRSRNVELDPNLEVSHLCHNTRCFKADHLVQEPKDVNLSRNACFLMGLRCGPDGDIWSPCTHSPKCLLLVRGNLSKATKEEIGKEAAKCMQ